MRWRCKGELERKGYGEGGGDEDVREMERVGIWTGIWRGDEEGEGKRGREEGDVRESESDMDMEREERGSERVGI